MLKYYLLVGTGGAVGSVLRFMISNMMYNSVENHSFPWATLMVNLLGSFVIGFFAGMGHSGLMNINYNLLFISGLLGGFTTFSAFSMESLHMLQMQQFTILFAYIACSLIGGIALAYGGLMAIKSII
ncbi:MAG: fluoride efflux transporter CrcB [Bacteroidetes bacterium]|nr:MAG: fluoride efflux transporter CrcB [Bacteroidota bacterium]REK08087.1 MAG: fluoride efflux transporter CrcB [Bacteroidota bacterium]REK32292.1 MAG: fluoride efflux transporter CrcB [Bacteroidota bacterium]REK49526.1 MAG: fluoride efflux transporter CrcB [Bacteroidota bacterium]